MISFVAVQNFPLVQVLKEKEQGKKEKKKVCPEKKKPSPPYALWLKDQWTEVVNLETRINVLQFNCFGNTCHMIVVLIGLLLILSRLRKKTQTLNLRRYQPCWQRNGRR